MNPILERQLKPQNILKLAAQRVTYSEAKTVQAFQITFVVVVATILAVISILYESVAGIIALLSIVLILIDFMFFEPAINKRKQLGAQIQESFDCGVLDIDCAVFKATDPEIEDVLEKADRIGKYNPKAQNIIGWYSDKIENLPIYLARLVCQRSNIKWDSNLRKRYINFLLLPIIMIIVALVLIWFFSKIDRDHFALIVAAVLPALIFFARQRVQNQEAVERLDEMMRQFNGVWERATKEKISGNELEKASRQIQDEIYQHRTQSPLVPDFYYFIYRDKDENFMEIAVAEYAALSKE